MRHTLPPRDTPPPPPPQQVAKDQGGVLYGQGFILIESRIEGRGALISPCVGCGLSPLIRSALAARQLLPVVTRDKGSPKLLFKRPNVVTAPALTPATIAVHVHVLHLHTFYLLNSSENISISLNVSHAQTGRLRHYFQYMP